MAVTGALLTRQRVLKAGIETTTGTAASTMVDLLNVLDPKIDPTIPATEREAMNTLSYLVPVPGARMGKATFKSELIGGASDPAWAATLLSACGFLGSSHVYAPKTGNQATATIGAYIAGRLLEITGAMGKVTFELEVGKPGYADWEFNGIWQPATTASVPAPTKPTVIPPRVAGITFTIGSTVYNVPKIEITVDNTLYMREDVTNVSGYAGCFITVRKITVKVSPEALTTKDWFADHLAGTGAALAIQLGTTGNEISFAAPNLVLLNPPQYEDRSGIYADNLEFLAAGNSSVGDDELTITIG